LVSRWRFEIGMKGLTFSASCDNSVAIERQLHHARQPDVPSDSECRHRLQDLRDERRYPSGLPCRARMPSHESRGLKDDWQAGPSFITAHASHQRRSAHVGRKLIERQRNVDARHLRIHDMNSS
jgi:hypothetical protein